jgi:hypothetical protein
MLEKANLYAQLYIRPNEQTLSRALGIATGDVLPLNDKGERVWPKARNADSIFQLLGELNASQGTAFLVANASGRGATKIPPFGRGHQSQYRPSALRLGCQRQGRIKLA